MNSEPDAKTSVRFFRDEETKHFIFMLIKLGVIELIDLHEHRSGRGGGRPDINRRPDYYSVEWK